MSKFSATVNLMLSLVFVSTAIGHVKAEEVRDDYDLDDDGLIEIRDLFDLDNIRHHLDGTALYGLNHGCPAAGCVGFELTQDLNFDSNGDNRFDEQDVFWNQGTGWQPVGEGERREQGFTGVFEGNGHKILNLVIARPAAQDVGLFAQTYGAEIRHLGLTGTLMSVAGGNKVGALAGTADHSRFIDCFATGPVVANIGGGGLIGAVFDSSQVTDERSLIRGSYATGDVQVAASYAGGLVGLSSPIKIEGAFATGDVFAGQGAAAGILNSLQISELTATFSTGRVSAGAPPVGGSALAGGKVIIKGSFTTSFVGPAPDAGALPRSATDSVWASDATGQSGGFTLEELRCPTAANNTDCADATLYVGWQAYLGPDGQGYWDYGNSDELPGLRIQSQTFRDGDGDGALDRDDAFPRVYAAALDRDGDGAPDRWHLNCDQACRDRSELVLDLLPQNAAAWQDADLDGQPEAWGPGCDANCQRESGLTLDIYPGDRDNDGLPDSLDPDQDGNGLEDADRDSDGLLDIANLEELNAVRNDLDGWARRLTQDGTADASGCPAEIVDGLLQPRCFGYELIADLDFDTDGDGVISKADAYWNRGRGWSSIGSYSVNWPTDGFRGTFDGNGFEIRNLMINQPYVIGDADTDTGDGLFSFTSGATLRNLVLTGPMMDINGADGAAGIVGYAFETLLQNSYVDGSIRGTGGVGGLVGQGQGVVIESSFARGRVEGNDRVGGLIGDASDSHLQAVYASSNVRGDQFVGGLLGYAAETSVAASYTTGAVDSRGATAGGLIGGGESVTVEQSYWTHNRRYSFGGGEQVAIAELTCLDACGPNGRLDLWRQAADAQGQPFWSLEGSGLPLLRQQPAASIDSDGDGTPDRDDAFPAHFAAAQDADGDGSPDAWTRGCDRACQEQSPWVLDRFPEHASAAIDADGDGWVDHWNPGCDASCQEASGLAFDLHPNDRDNDGLNDRLDHDHNNDGQIDADRDGDGLIEVSTLEQLYAVNFEHMGRGRVMERDGPLDSSGCPVFSELGSEIQRRCHGYELIADLNFDSNGDGVLSEADDFYAIAGYWSGIGDLWPFSAVFEGNGHVIRGLRVPGARPFLWGGLFSQTQGAVIRNLGLTGGQAERIADAILVKRAKHSTISNCFVIGDIYATESVAALVANAHNALIESSFFVGQMHLKDGYARALVGRASDSRIVSSFATGSVGVAAGSLTQGARARLLGVKSESTIIEASFYSGYFQDANSSGFTHQHWRGGADVPGTEGGNIAQPSALEELQCPTGANDRHCTARTLYEGWDRYTTEKGEPVWDFGAANQLPALKVAGQWYRDSDGDGVLDGDDAFALQPAASRDEDSDGMPDRWHFFCDDACQQASSLVLDSQVGDEPAPDDVDNGEVAGAGSLLLFAILSLIAGGRAVGRSKGVLALAA